MKRKILIYGLLLGVIGVAQGQPAPAAPKVSQSKWFKDRRGYEEAVALQKQTGAPMLIYFANTSEPNERGLCSWWEKRGIEDGKVKKVIRDFIKVRIELPFSRRDEDLFASFRVRKTPAVFVKKISDPFPMYRAVFNWENNRPKLKEPEELAEIFAAAGAPPEKPAE